MTERENSQLLSEVRHDPVKREPDGSNSERQRTDQTWSRLVKHHIAISTDGTKNNQPNDATRTVRKPRKTGVIPPSPSRADGLNAVSARPRGGRNHGDERQAEIRENLVTCHRVRFGVDFISTAPISG